MTDIPRPLRARLLVPIVGVLAMIAVLAIAWKRQYDVGDSFTPGLHGFGFMLEMVWIVPALVIIATIQLIFAWPFRSIAANNDSVRLAALLIGIFALAAMFMSWPVMAGGLTAGRNAAYRRIDCPRLAAGCRAVRIDELSGKPDATEVFLLPFDAAYAKLPPEIRELKPIRFYAGKRGVIVQMDGGGPATHEGFFVPLTTFEDDPEALEVVSRLSELSHDPRVYRYWLYDCRMLPYE